MGDGHGRVVLGNVGRPGARIGVGSNALNVESGIDTTPRDLYSWRTQANRVYGEEAIPMHTDGSVTTWAEREPEVFIGRRESDGDRRIVERRRSDRRVGSGPTATDVRKARPRP